MVRRCAVVLLAVLVLLALALLGALFQCHVVMQQVACERGMGQIHLALLMYAADYDGRLPLRASLQDLAGTGWTQNGHITCEQFGPIGVYARSAALFDCPSDSYSGRRDRFPKPGISYVWREELAGKRVDKLAPQTTLLWDREPFHRAKRNVAVLGMPEDDDLDGAAVQVGGQVVPERIALPKVK